MTNKIKHSQGFIYSLENDWELGILRRERLKKKATKTITIYKSLLPVHFHHPSSKEISAKSKWNMIPHTRLRVFWAPDRGIAKTAMSPLIRAATAATAKAGEFPPPNS